MKTFKNFRNVAIVAAICTFTMVSLTGYAQKNGKRDQERDVRHDKYGEHDETRNQKNKHDYRPNKHEYRNERGRKAYANYGNQYDYQKYNHYSRQAPWGRHRPVVMNHRNGHVYFYGGRYYEYHPRHGYIMINYPVNYVFNQLPYGSRKVWIDGQYYFRYDNTFFRPIASGFAIVQLPRQVVITGNF